MYLSNQTLQTKGELHADKKEAYERHQKAYEKLLSNTSILAVSTFNGSVDTFLCIMTVLFKVICSA